MEIDYTAGAELEFYICSSNGEIIADLASGKFPQKRFAILDKYKAGLAAYFDELKKLGYDISEESGPGQFEVQFKPASDKGQLAEEISVFKEKSQELAVKHEFFINFAAKPFEGHCGNGLHIHYCSPLFDPYGLIANNGAMSQKNEPENKYMLWAMGGMLANIGKHSAVFFPNQESVKRIVPYLNAPTKICWGRNNRSCALRIPDSRPKRTEHRVAGADADAARVIDAVISDAAEGINNKIEAGEAIFGNAWDSQYILAPIV